MRASMRGLLSVLLGCLCLSMQAYAEGNCPPGQYQVNGQGWQGCNPIPGYGNQQRAPQQQASQQPAEVWQDRYGAIYLDLPKGAIGTSTRLASRPAAEQAAIADCKAKGGIDCKQEASYGNGCIAFVIDDNWHGAFFSNVPDIAKQTAVHTCKGIAGNVNCRVYYTDCSLPVRIR